MLKIPVKHRIWDIVEHSFNEKKYKIIWYNYIENRWPQYICLWSDREEYMYMNDCELKSHKERNIWFVIKK